MKTKYKIVVLDSQIHFIEAAVTAYVSLQRRDTHPDGTFDKSKRWEPSERFCCCHNIRKPSAAFPYSLLVHARTTQHVFHQNNIVGLQLSEFRSLCRSAKSLTALDAATAAAVVIKDKISVQLTFPFDYPLPPVTNDTAASGLHASKEIKEAM